MTLHVVREPDDERQQDEGPDDLRYEEFGFELDEPDKPSYANGRRRPKAHPSRRLGELGPPPNGVLALLGADVDRIGRRNAYCKVDFADLAKLEALDRRIAHDAICCWSNLLAHQEVRTPKGSKSGQATGVVRTSVAKLQGPWPLGRHAVEAALSTLVDVGLVQPYQTSRREARILVLVPVYLRFVEPDRVRHTPTASTHASTSHADGLSASHGGEDQSPSASHGGEDSPLTTPTSPTAEGTSSRSPPGDLHSADHAAAAPTTLAGAAGAARPAAAAASAAKESLTTRKDWGQHLGKDNYTWEEIEHVVKVTTKMFYEDEDKQDRALTISWEVDTITETALVSFPRSKGYPEIKIPWEEVVERSNKTWLQFTQNEEHGYLVWDYLICIERLLYVFAKRHTPIDSPVGFLKMVTADILSKHRWGECAFTDHRLTKPKETTASEAVR